MHAQEDIAATASRLELALKRKIGHAVVIGDERNDVNIFVSVVLGGISGYQVIELSGEYLELPDVSTLYGGPRTIAAVYDADLLSAADLEELRVWAEGLVAVMLILVGTSVLERTLMQPEAKPLVDLLHSRITLVRDELEGGTAHAAASRNGSVSSFVVAGLIAIGIGFAVGAQSGSHGHFVSAVSDGFSTSVAWLSALLR